MPTHRLMTAYRACCTKALSGGTITAGMPESFNVLVKEICPFGIDMELERESSWWIVTICPVQLD
jgi:DNA-directed RNA polymerase beta subunit